MDVQPSPTSTIVQTAPSASSQLTGDFETFLRMLTVQVQNQDPLNPIDSSDYAVQLATFSSVEQQLRTNTLLAQLVQGGAGLQRFGSWIGQSAQAAMPVSTEETNSFDLSTPWAPGADAADLLVRDEKGQLVERLALKMGQERLTWSSEGLSKGRYRFDIESFEAGALTAQTQAQVFAKVQEVQAKDGLILLKFAGGVTVDATQVTGLRP